MSILIFILILGALIFVHELGHFLFAKWSKMRVDEFAIGFPPRIFSFKKGETNYALNLIPFGGYVKIFGENPDDASADPDANNSFVNKSKWQQAAVLIAGVLFNIIFAWLLFSIGFLSGVPTVVTDENKSAVTNPRVMITNVAPESPALEFGLVLGDVITEIDTATQEPIAVQSVADVQAYITQHEDETLLFTVTRNGEENPVVVPVEAREGVVEGKKAVGIMMGLIGEMKLGFFKAFGYGALTTVEKTKEVAVGLGTFLQQIVTGKANFNQVAGPVGIVGLVGDASEIGFIFLLSFTAVISLNLAVLNLIPFPALDGGRLLFILIEAIIRKPIPHKIANTINAVGFLILITLMVVITISDVIKLF
jgi:regulator of sigma E protease